MEVGIIIVNLNGKDLLKDCLNSIKKYTPEEHKIVIVDNGSTDGSIEFIKKNYPKVDIVKNKENKGFPIANNQGTSYLLEKYDPKYYYFLNNDTKVTKDWLKNAIQISKEYNAGMVASRQLDFEGNKCKTIGKINIFGVKYYLDEEIKEVKWANGAAFLLTDKVIKEVGLLDEKYSPAYYEETDFEARALKKGFKIFYAPSSLVYHKWGQTSSKTFKQDRVFYLFHRNRILFFIRHYSWFYFLPRLFFDIIKSIKSRRLKLLFKSYKDGLKLLP